MQCLCFDSATPPRSRGPSDAPPVELVNVAPAVDVPASAIETPLLPTVCPDLSPEDPADAPVDASTTLLGVRARTMDWIHKAPPPAHVPFDFAQIQAFQPFVPLEVTSLYYDMFQRSLKTHMVDPTSARPGYLSQADIPFPLPQPRVDAIDAALLFVDMSGFTPLTERMCLKGMAGVEELSRHLNRFFGPICDRIYEYGGDVLKFAGDALLVMFTDHNRYDALFPAPEVSDSFDSEHLSNVNPRPEPLSKQGELVLRALRCAQRLHAEFNEWKPVPDITLRLHSGVACGRVYGLHVALKQLVPTSASDGVPSLIKRNSLNRKVSVGPAGDMSNMKRSVSMLRRSTSTVNAVETETKSDNAANTVTRIEYLIKGSPLPQLGEAMHLAENGQIVLAAAAFALVRSHILHTEVLHHEGDHTEVCGRFEGFDPKLVEARCWQPAPSLATPNPNVTLQNSAESGISRCVEEDDSFNQSRSQRKSRSNPSLLRATTGVPMLARSKTMAMSVLTENDEEDIGADVSSIQVEMNATQAITKAEAAASPSGRILSLNDPRVSAMHDIITNRWVRSLSDSFGTYVPTAVLSRVKGGQQNWLAEFRRVTTLFILLPEQANFTSVSDQVPVWRAGDDSPDASLESIEARQAIESSLWELQKIVGIIGDVARAHSGDIRQVITDDKGTVAIVVFGLQAAAKMQSHAVCAAVQMFDQVKEQCNASLAIGVTTGNVFCGAIGSSTRCEYAVVGDKVNMAARLMASTFKAISKDDTGARILVDEPTTETIREMQSSNENQNDVADMLLAFNELSPIMVKGVSKPINIYQPFFPSKQPRLSQIVVDRASESSAPSPLRPSLPPVERSFQPMGPSSPSPSSTPGVDENDQMDTSSRRKAVFHRQFLVGRDNEIESVQQKIVDFFVSPRPSSLSQPLTLFQLNNISEQARQCFANGNKSSAPTVLTLIGKLIKKHELTDGSESPKMSNLTTLFRRTSFAGRSPPPMMSKQRHQFSPCSVVFEGSPGSGKSLLVRTASDSATRLGIQVVSLSADENDRLSPFSAFRRLVSDLFQPFVTFDNELIGKTTSVEDAIVLLFDSIGSDSKSDTDFTRQFPTVSQQLLSMFQRARDKLRTKPFAMQEAILRCEAEEAKQKAGAQAWAALPLRLQDWLRNNKLMLPLLSFISPRIQLPSHHSGFAVNNMFATLDAHTRIAATIELMASLWQTIASVDVAQPTMTPDSFNAEISDFDFARSRARSSSVAVLSSLLKNTNNNSTSSSSQPVLSKSPLLRSISFNPLAEDIPQSDDARILSGVKNELVGAEFRKYFLVIENYQCLDSASESLTSALIEHLSPFVCFAITRKTAVTDQTGSTSKIQFLNGFPHMKSIWLRSLVIHLGSLPHEAIKEMICLRFEVNDVADSIVDAIAAKSNGVALFVSELTAALATTKFVHVVKGKLKLAAGYDPAQAMASLPTNVEDVIGARIDGLPPTEQMLVKVCAVAGVSFRIAPVFFAFPVRDWATLESLDERLESLFSMGFLVRTGGNVHSTLRELRSVSGGKSMSIVKKKQLMKAQIALRREEQHHIEMKKRVVNFTQSDVDNDMTWFPFDDSIVEASVPQSRGAVFQLDSHIDLLSDSDSESESSDDNMPPGFKFVDNRHDDSDEDQIKADADEVKSSSLASLQCSFSNVLMREVAYKRLPFRYRCELHRHIATWFETTYAKQLAPYTQTLAHHWQVVAECENDAVLKTIARRKAIMYLQRSAQWSRGQRANAEALQLFEQAIEQLDELPLPAFNKPSHRRARSSIFVADALAAGVNLMDPIAEVQLNYPVDTVTLLQQSSQRSAMFMAALLLTPNAKNRAHFQLSNSCVAESAVSTLVPAMRVHLTADLALTSQALHLCAMLRGLTHVSTHALAARAAVMATLLFEFNCVSANMYAAALTAFVTTLQRQPAFEDKNELIHSISLRCCQLKPSEHSISHHGLHRHHAGENPEASAMWLQLTSLRLTIVAMMRNARVNQAASTGNAALVLLQHQPDHAQLIQRDTKLDSVTASAIELAILQSASLDLILRFAADAGVAALSAGALAAAISGQSGRAHQLAAAATVSAEQLISHYTASNNSDSDSNEQSQSVMDPSALLSPLATLCLVLAQLRDYSMLAQFVEHARATAIHVGVPQELLYSYGESNQTETPSSLLYASATIALASDLLNAERDSTQRKQVAARIAAVQRKLLLSPDPSDIDTFGDPLSAALALRCLELDVGCNSSTIYSAYSIITRWCDSAFCDGGDLAGASECGRLLACFQLREASLMSINNRNMLAPSDSDQSSGAAANQVFLSVLRRLGHVHVLNQVQHHRHLAFPPDKLFGAIITNASFLDTTQVDPLIQRYRRAALDGTWTPTVPDNVSSSDFFAARKMSLQLCALLNLCQSRRLAAQTGERLLLVRALRDLLKLMQSSVFASLQRELNDNIAEISEFLSQFGFLGSDVAAEHRSDALRAMLSTDSIQRELRETLAAARALDVTDTENICVDFAEAESIL